MDLETELSRICSALSDPKRLLILNMLRTGELCACEILGEFSITQPTLSHHMDILCSNGLVNARREGRWIFYSLNHSKISLLREYLINLEKNVEKNHTIPDCCDNYKQISLFL